MKGDNLVLDKSFQFAQQIVFLYKQLIDKSDNRVLATQLLKSGTSIGANIREAVRSQSRNEFLAKMNISLKEACVELGFLTAEKFDEVFHPEEMV